MKRSSNVDRGVFALLVASPKGDQRWQTPTDTGMGIREARELSRGSGLIPQKSARANRTVWSSFVMIPATATLITIMK